MRDGCRLAARLWVPVDARIRLAAARPGRRRRALAGDLARAPRPDVALDPAPAPAPAPRPAMDARLGVRGPEPHRSRRLRCRRLGGRLLERDPAALRRTRAPPVLCRGGGRPPPAGPARESRRRRARGSGFAPTRPDRSPPGVPLPRPWPPGRARPPARPDGHPELQGPGPDPSRRDRNDHRGAGRRALRHRRGRSALRGARSPVRDRDVAGRLAHPHRVPDHDDRDRGEVPGYGDPRRLRRGRAGTGKGLVGAAPARRNPIVRGAAVSQGNRRRFPVRCRREGCPRARRARRRSARPRTRRDGRGSGSSRGPTSSRAGFGCARRAPRGRSDPRH